MKKVFLAVVALFMVANVVMAEDNNGDYNRIVLGASLTDVNTTKGVTGNGVISPSDWDNGLYGLNIGYVHGFKLSENKNMYIQTGLNFRTEGNDNKDENGHTVDKEWGVMSLTVPVNFTYKFQFAHVFVEPYAGLNARVNLLAKEQVSGLTFDMFDSQDAVYGTFNRMQYGAQVGVNVGFRHVVLGFEYGNESDLAKFNKNLNKNCSLTPEHITFSVAYAF